MTGLCWNTRPCIYRSLNHLIPSTERVCYFFVWTWLTDAGRAGIQPALTSPSSLHMLRFENDVWLKIAYICLSFITIQDIKCMCYCWHNKVKPMSKPTIRQIYQYNPTRHFTLLGFVRRWRFSAKRFYSGFKVIEAEILFTETSDYFLGNYMVVTNLTLVDKFASHMLNGLFTNCDTWLASSCLG